MFKKITMGGEALQFTKKKGNTTHCLSIILLTYVQCFNDRTIALNIFFN